jgi:hypothetical protein
LRGTSEQHRTESEELNAASWGGKDCVRKEHKKANLPKKGRKQKNKQHEMKLTYLFIATKTKAPSQSHQPQQQ